MDSVVKMVVDYLLTLVRYAADGIGSLEVDCASSSRNRLSFGRAEQILFVDLVFEKFRCFSWVRRWLLGSAGRVPVVRRQVWPFFSD